MAKAILHSSRLILFILFSFYFSQLWAKTDQHKIVWIYAKNLHNELDLSTGKVKQEVKPGIWAKEKLVELVGVDLVHFPAEYDIHAHKVKYGYLFNVPGTGLVFTLDSNLKQFKRLDNTFFKGFNFHSYSFVKNDTLFSIGGEGFWNTNSTLIYFDYRNQEWEKVFTVNKGPASLEWNFGGFSNSNNTFYSLNGYEEFKDNAFKNRAIYSLDLKTLTWKELGNINTEFFRNKILSNAKQWLDGFFIYLDGDKPNVLLLDPIRNKILIYEGKHNQLKLGSNEISRDGDQLFLYRKESNGISMDSISVKELFDDSREVGKMYTKKIEIPWLLIISIALFLAILFSIILYLRLKNYQQKYLWFKKSHKIEDLPEHLINVLKHFQNNGVEAMLSTIEMNELLGIKTNSFETTRQQRSKDLKAINDYFEINHNICEAIQRKNSEKDKRHTYYSMDERAFKILSKLNFGNYLNLM